MKNRSVKRRFYTGRQLVDKNAGRYDANYYGVKPDYVKHFWPCDEYMFSNMLTGRIHDVVGGYHLPDAQEGCYTYPVNTDEFHVTTANGSRYLEGAPTGHFECFAGNDWIILVASKARGNGCFEWTTGRPGVGITNERVFIKAQPYYLMFNYEGGLQTAPWGNIQTRQHDSPVTPRIVGTDYIIAYVKRGEKIQHWVNGVMQSENDLSLLNQAQGRTYQAICEAGYNVIHNMRPIARVRCGHSATTDISQQLRSSNADYDYPHMDVPDGTTPDYLEIPASFPVDSVKNEHTQYAGVMFCAWTTGEMPTDVAAFMNWHQAQWMAGNKRIDY